MSNPDYEPSRDPLDGTSAAEVDARFAAIVSGWEDPLAAPDPPGQQRPESPASAANSPQATQSASSSARSSPTAPSADSPPSAADDARAVVRDDQTPMSTEPTMTQFNGSQDRSDAQPVDENHSGDEVSGGEGAGNSVTGHPELGTPGRRLIDPRGHGLELPITPADLDAAARRLSARTVDQRALDRARRRELRKAEREIEWAAFHAEQARIAAERAADQEHFEPPEPPPLPHFRRRTIAALLLVTIGLVLIIAPYLFFADENLVLVVGVLALLSGLGLLASRMRRRSGDPADGDGWDNGARL